MGFELRKARVSKGLLLITSAHSRMPNPPSDLKSCQPRILCKADYEDGEL